MVLLLTTYWNPIQSIMESKVVILTNDSQVPTSQASLWECNKNTCMVLIVNDENEAKIGLIIDITLLRATSHTSQELFP